MKFFLTTLLTILAFFSFVSGAPVQLAARDVFVPPVISPNNKSTWKIGSTQTVKWDVTHPPKQITNTGVQIILVKAGKLDMEHPLAVGKNVMEGSLSVTVPKVAPGSDYQVLVFGDSGNTGEFFTITA
ncbi:hypothetical protein B0H34DRAFT_656283 [Crassisporium funariophilum]|nr:hypothetical protein B0H34DRAFT_656283 [Crassisporium funariophilum]